MPFGLDGASVRDRIVTFILQRNRAVSAMFPAPMHIAINGYGRVGRCFLRAIYESGFRDAFRISGINEPADLSSMAYLTRFDSTHGRFPGKVEVGEGALLLDGDAIPVFHETIPEGVDWRGLEIDLLVECSGRYGDRASLTRFLDAGCARLLLSHPGDSAADVDATVVFGTNHSTLSGKERLVSNASCTTNAVVPVLSLLHRELNIEQVQLTTLHSVMNDQPLIDGYHHPDLRRTRSAMQSIVPVSTGLARGVERVLPELKSRVHAKAIRVPTHNVSSIDIVLSVGRDVSAASINDLLKSAAAGPYAGLIAYSNEPHASIDFNHDPHSAIIDGTQTHVSGHRLVNLMLWFDNEWGYVSRLLDVARHWLKAT